MYMIIMRIVQGIGGALLMANSTAILTDAFGPEERGTALGINMVAGIAGSFIGLVLGGVLADVDWRLVFWVNVPFGLFGTLWAYLKLREMGSRTPAKLDWAGNVTFAAGLISILIGITYGIQPYRHHTMGWTSPVVLGELIGGAAAARVVLRRRAAGGAADVPPGPVQDPGLHRRQPVELPLLDRTGRPAVHAHHLAAGHLAASPRLQLRAHPALGRHLHAAAHRRVPHGRRLRPAL